VKIKQEYIQLLGDAIIPLAGAFFFDWSLYFILIFYCLDLVALEVILHLKSKKTVEFRGISKNEWSKRGLISALLLVFVLALIHLAVFFIEPNIDFTQQLYDFVMYEELGIPQGIVLVPLIAFSAYQLYKMNFLMPARFRTISMDQIWKPHLVSLLIMFAFSGVIIGISQFIVFHELVYVLGIVLISFAYQIWRIMK